jgi:hypothetical protein
MWQRISREINKITRRMAKTKKQKEVIPIDKNTVVDVLVPNRVSETSIERMSLGIIEGELLTKQQRLLRDDLRSKFVVDMTLEEGSENVFLFDISMRTKYYTDAYFMARKQLLYTVRKEFISETDISVLEFYHTLSAIIPKGN